MITIIQTNSNFEREPLSHPFGLKRGWLDELWQSVVLMQTEEGPTGLGVGTQSVLWSDPELFMANSQAASNSLMFAATAHALRAAEDIPFETPLGLMEQLLPITYDYAKKITRKADLRLTFALNALVAVDNAAWQLYCGMSSISTFDRMIPADCRDPLSVRHSKVAGIPLVTYGTDLDAFIGAIDGDLSIFKIRIGSDPDGDGDLDKMLEWDKNRLTQVHTAFRDRHAEHTESGHVIYYVDINGRYDSKDRLMRLIDHARKIGALEHILLIEEPFPEELEINVTDIPVRLAADESAHTDKNVLERIQMGYGAIALKPIAKTLSVTLKMARVAHEHGIPCFCADLTVNPILVDWNKNVAARLAPLPGMKIGAFESNGPQNYANWEMMKSYHPCAGAAWMNMTGGVFDLDDDFYARSGGVLQQSEHYLRLAG